MVPVVEALFINQILDFFKNFWILDLPDFSASNGIRISHHFSTKFYVITLYDDTFAGTDQILGNWKIMT